MIRLILLLTVVLSFSLEAVAQYDINISLENYDKDTVIIGNYYGDRTLVKDTVFRADDGDFHFSGEDTLASGVYLILLMPDNRYSQFMVNDTEKSFDIKWDTEDPTGVKVSGSKDNELFYRYLSFLEELRPRADELREKIAAAKAEDKKDEKAEAKLESLDVEVKSLQQEIVTDQPESMSALFIKSTIQQDIPEFEGSEQEVQLQTYKYYKKHYFDNVDLADPKVLRTPFLNDRVDYYMEKLTTKDPDSIMVSIDYLLDKMSPAPETLKFYTSYLINKYANMKIVGMDGVYVHMVDKYYSTGKANWVEAETLEKMKENANNIRPILIGRTFPAITTYLADGTPVEINKIESEYTLVLFWAHTCGHCTKSMPDVVDFYKEYQDKGVTLVSVCTKGGDKTKPCMDAIKGKGMENFLNTFDEHQRYRRKVYINSTPKIFILNKDKEIIIKDIPAKELKNVMKNVIEIDAKKKAEGAVE